MSKTRDVLDLSINISVGNTAIYPTHTGPITVPYGAMVTPFGDRGLSWKDANANTTTILDCKENTINGLSYQEFVARWSVPK